jgi:pimeloyl-ACP methyl ester carboxylesterase
MIWWGIEARSMKAESTHRTSTGVCAALFSVWIASAAVAQSTSTEVIMTVARPALIASTALAQSSSTGRVVDLNTQDGTTLKASYFAASGPGPGVLLYHQRNRTRASWERVARQLAAVGIHVLSVDSRGHGESGGKEGRKWRPRDQDVAFEWLAAQPGVKREAIGIGGAGGLGVANAVETAHRHSANVKSLVLLSGETFRPELEFLHQASQLPGLFVVSDDDEYSPLPEAMQLLYASASSPAKKLIHYVAEEESPWRWYEPFDVGKVAATGGHGTDLFTSHAELPGIIVRWFATTLVRTPGHAPADPIAAGPLLVEVAFGGGVAHAREQLLEARRRDPEVQLWPEVSMTEIGEGLLGDGNIRAALEVFKLNLLAYPDSADANENMAEGYLADHQNDLARQYAQESLALLKDERRPASSWTNTEEYRGEIRAGAEKVLKSAGLVSR